MCAAKAGTHWLGPWCVQGRQRRAGGGSGGGCRQREAGSAKNRGTDGEQGRSVLGCGRTGLCLVWKLIPKETCDVLAHAVLSILPGIRRMVSQFSIDLRREMVFPAKVGQFPFDHRIQFFDAENFVQSVEKFQRKFLRERMRRRNLEKTDHPDLFQSFHGVCKADASCGNSAFLRLFSRFQRIFRLRENAVSLI